MYLLMYSNVLHNLFFVGRVMYTCTESHYLEVAQGAIFMDQNMRFGLILGKLAILKKKLDRL